MPQSKEKLVSGKRLHFSVGAIIEQGGKYLLIDRNVPPLGFASIAGHIDEGYTEVETLVKEVREESGLTIEHYRLLYEERLDWNWCSQGAEQHHWYVFFCRVSGEVRCNPREVKSIGWYTPDEIQSLQLEPVWEYWFTKFGLVTQR